jgi:hypothetical protein
MSDDLRVLKPRIRQGRTSFLEKLRFGVLVATGVGLIAAGAFYKASSTMPREDNYQRPMLTELHIKDPSSELGYKRCYVVDEDRDLKPDYIAENTFGWKEPILAQRSGFTSKLTYNKHYFPNKDTKVLEGKMLEAVNMSFNNPNEIITVDTDGSIINPRAER